MSIYRKSGRVVRWENGTVVRVVERGVAIEDGETFRCYPETSDEELPDPANVLAVAKRIPGNVERLSLTEGEAAHDCDGRRWTDRTRRLHLALVRDRLRVLIDQADFDLTHIEHVAKALDLAGAEREAPRRLRLAPNVAAALLPFAPPGVRIVQTEGGVDGKGFPMEKEPPNWWRPSYRVRPVRTPMNIRAEGTEAAVDPALPVAIALLAPVHDLTLRVLVEHGDDVWPAAVHVRRIEAVATATHFYPYGAGSFGAEMVL